MNVHFKLSWPVATIVAGVSYGFIGIVFAIPSFHVRAWRLAAWIISGAIFITHIACDRYGLHNSRLATALHASIAVALGAFFLAVGATVHAAMVPSHAPYWQYAVAFVMWPLITAVPAFLVALVLVCLPLRVPPNRVSA
jgi:hypothetical protein